MDWKNKHQVIANKIKSQLHARGHDTLKALHNYFVVILIHNIFLQLMLFLNKLLVQSIKQFHFNVYSSY